MNSQINNQLGASRASDFGPRITFARIVSRTIGIATIVLAFYEAMFEPPGSWSPVKFWIALFVSAIVQRSTEGGSSVASADFQGQRRAPVYVSGLDKCLIDVAPPAIDNQSAHDLSDCGT